MKFRINRCLIVFVLPFLLAPFPVGAQSKSAEVPLVILHVTVINPGASSVESDRAVVVRGNHIAAVSDSTHIHLSANTRVIDGTGRFLIPGLWDMHVHSVFGDWFPG